ncbi:MAG: beta-ketoacyl-ACP synthase III [Microcystaceae cyanobacterium]
MNAFGAGLKIIGCGSAAPTSYLTNGDLSQLVETSDEWIASRTGIKQRHIGSEQEELTNLAVKAATNALKMAQVAPTDVDLIILATSTPDDLFGTAGRIQHQLGANKAVAFDLTAACSGFIFALVTASQFIATGTYETVVVIGGDVLSRWVDWSDRTTCVLFGDGAGAVVVKASEENQLLSHGMYSDGSLHHCLNLAYQGEPTPLKEGVNASQGTFHPITMNGREVYRFAVARVPEVIEKTLFQAKLTTKDIDWLILHQANQRIMDAVASRLKIPSEKVISNLNEYGNTSAASIPLALDEAVRGGKIKTGDIIATSGFGAGLSWGAAIFRWG